MHDLSFQRPPLIALLLIVLCAGHALAADEKSPSTENPMTHPGFDRLRWGATADHLYKVYPKLRRSSPPRQVRKALRAGNGVFMDTRVTYRGRPFQARFVLDETGRLERVVLSLEISKEQGAGALAQIVDQLMGRFDNPETDADGRKIWKGSETVVVASQQRLPGATKLDLTFYKASVYKPAGASLGID